MSSPRSSTAGFSLLEAVVATALVMSVMAAAFSAIAPMYGTSGTAPEAADLQQRLRVIAEQLANDIGAAGGGGAIPGLLPFRQGRRNADPPGTFRDDTITVIGVLPAPQASLASPLAAQPSNADIRLEPGCPVNDPACGFRSGTSLLVFDDTGAFDTFTAGAVAGATLALQHNMRDGPHVYPPGSRFTEVVSRTYALKVDRATNLPQLIRYEGGAGADVPVADHVVSLRFEYRADPVPPAMRKALADPVGPWTTYGPKPPSPEEQPTAFPVGENCVFERDVLREPVSRLPQYGGRNLVTIGAAELTDGPWCPDAASPGRYDADLLRVRSVVVSLRVESASDTRRGPDAALFARPGPARDPGRWVPDQSLRFVVSPRNLRSVP